MVDTKTEQLDTQLATTKKQRSAAEAERKKLEAISQNLTAIAQAQKESQRLIGAISKQSPDTPLDVEKLFAETKENRAKAESQNRKLKAIFENLQVVTQCETADKRLRGEINRLETASATKA